MTDKELMQQALYVFDLFYESGFDREDCFAVIKALRERLAQPEQEPVCDKDPQGCWNVRCQLGKVCKHAAPRQWQGLTKKEFLAAVDGLEDLEDCWVAIEAKLKEKNG